MTFKYTILLSGLLVASCKNEAPSSALKANPDDALPSTARCAQVSEVETVVVHETLLLKLAKESVSGTYQFTTGERSQIQDAGFQHLTGRIAELKSENKVVEVTLSEGSLSVYFDEDFAPEKNLNALKLDFNEKKVSFTIEGDTRATVVGNCIFE
ncbi:MAG: hypothetical protein RJB13_1422 [Pseudomonadota bacterium]